MCAIGTVRGQITAAAAPDDSRPQSCGSPSDRPAMIVVDGPADAAVLGKNEWDGLTGGARRRAIAPRTGFIALIVLRLPYQDTAPLPYRWFARRSAHPDCHCRLHWCRFRRDRMLHGAFFSPPTLPSQGSPRWCSSRAFCEAAATFRLVGAASPEGRCGPPAPEGGTRRYRSDGSGGASR